MGGAAWSLCGALVSQGLGLATLVLVARLLGKEGYGSLGMVRSTVGMFAALGTGLSLAVTKQVAASRDGDPGRAGRILWLSSVGGAVVGVMLALTVAALSGFLSRAILNAPALATELRLGCGLLLFTLLASIQNGSLAGLEAFRAIAVVNLLRGVVSLPLTCFLTAACGVRGAVVGLMMSAVVGFAIGEAAIRRECATRRIHRSGRGWSAEAPLLWRFSAVLLLCDLIGPPATWAANALLVQQAGGYAEMGIFSAGVDWMVVAMAVPSLITSALLPVSSGLRAQGDGARFARFAKRALVGIACISLAISLGLAACAPMITSLYGKSFSGHLGVLALMLASAGLANVSNGMRAVAISSDHHAGVLASFAAYGVVMVAVMFLQRGHGASGRAWSHLSADAALFIGLLVVNAWILRAGREARSFDEAAEPMG